MVCKAKRCVSLSDDLHNLIRAFTAINDEQQVQQYKQLSANHNRVDDENFSGQNQNDYQTNLLANFCIELDKRFFIL